MKKKNIVRALKIVWGISPLYCIGKIFSVLLSTIVPLLSAWIMTFIIDAIVYEFNYYTAVKGIVLYTGINIFYSIFICYMGRVTVKMNANIELSINKQIIFKLSRVEYSFFDKADHYNNIEKASREIDKLVKILDDILELFASLSAIIFIMPHMAQLGFYFILLIIISNVPSVFLQMRLKQFNASTQKDIVYYKRCISGTNNMLINKSYAGEVRAFGLKNWLFGKFEEYFNKRVEISYERNKVGSSYELIINILSLITIALIQLQIINKVSIGVLTIGSFTLYNNYIIRLNDSVLQIVNRITSLYEKELFMDNLFSFLDGDFDNINDKKVEVVDNKLHEIEFKNVTFKYDNLEKNVLENISFKIREGQIIALVGLNGVGKTTIFNLILRFYRPQQGVILLDGKDINEYDIDSYYKSIAVVFQRPKLYPFSLKENICFGNDMQCKRSQMHDWIIDLINKYPYGENTIMLPYFDPKGIEPSHGETQRIGLERAFYKDSNILLLDEPSASMDAEIEYKIFRDLKKLCNNKTAIIISHRLSAVTSADCIIVIKDAQIAEMGTHEELLKQQGEYAKLFNMQAEKYKRGE